jgi:hypothetical protein
MINNNQIVKSNYIEKDKDVRKRSKNKKPKTLFYILRRLQKIGKNIACMKQKQGC